MVPPVIFFGQKNYNTENLEAHAFCIKNLLLQEPLLTEYISQIYCFQGQTSISRPHFLTWTTVSICRIVEIFPVKEDWCTFVASPRNKMSPKKMPEVISRTSGIFRISSLDALRKVDVPSSIHAQLNFQWLCQLPSLVLSPALKLLGFGVEIFLQ